MSELIVPPVEPHGPVSGNPPTHPSSEHATYDHVAGFVQLPPSPTTRRICSCVSKLDPHVLKSYCPVAAGVKVNHTPRMLYEDEHRFWQKSFARAPPLFPTRGTPTVNASAPPHWSFTGAPPQMNVLVVVKQAPV
jgi:hypothetical protein